MATCHRSHGLTGVHTLRAEGPNQYLEGQPTAPEASWQLQGPALSPHGPCASLLTEGACIPVSLRPGHRQNSINIPKSNGSFHKVESQASFSQRKVVFLLTFRVKSGCLFMRSECPNPPMGRLDGGTAPAVPAGHTLGGRLPLKGPATPTPTLRWQAEAGSEVHVGDGGRGDP